MKSHRCNTILLGMSHNILISPMIIGNWVKWKQQNQNFNFEKSSLTIGRIEQILDFCDKITYLQTGNRV